MQRCSVSRCARRVSIAYAHRSNATIRRHHHSIHSHSPYTHVRTAGKLKFEPDFVKMRIIELIRCGWARICVTHNDRIASSVISAFAAVIVVAAESRHTHYPHCHHQREQHYWREHYFLCIYYAIPNLTSLTRLGVRNVWLKTIDSCILYRVQFCVQQLTFITESRWMIRIIAPTQPRRLGLRPPKCDQTITTQHFNAFYLLIESIPLLSRIASTSTKQTSDVGLNASKFHYLFRAINVCVFRILPLRR